MKTLGMIGGIGPESTIDYYRSLISEYRSRVADGSHPSILINSIDLERMLRLIATNQLHSLAEYLGAEIAKLARAGAGFAFHLRPGNLADRDHGMRATAGR